MRNPFRQGLQRICLSALRHLSSSSVVHATIESWQLLCSTLHARAVRFASKALHQLYLRDECWRLPVSVLL
jgi:hypothetical protein